MTTYSMRVTREQFDTVEAALKEAAGFGNPGTSHSLRMEAALEIFRQMGRDRAPLPDDGWRPHEKTLNPIVNLAELLAIYVTPNGNRRKDYEQITSLLSQIYNDTVADARKAARHEVRKALRRVAGDD